MTNLKKATFAIMALLLSGCMSMPIGTIIKMSKFDINDFSRIDPAALRMRITSDSDDPLMVVKTKLTMQLTEKNGKQTHLGGALVLETEKDLKPERSFFSFSYQPEHVYVLKLNEEAVDSFGEIAMIMKKHHEQKLALEEEGFNDSRKGSFSLGTAYDFREKKEATIIVELLFDKKDGYFTLLNKVKFSPDVNMAEAESTIPPAHSDKIPASPRERPWQHGPYL